MGNKNTVEKPTRQSIGDKNGDRSLFGVELTYPDERRSVLMGERLFAKHKSAQECAITLNRIAHGGRKFETWIYVRSEKSRKDLPGRTGGCYVLEEVKDGKWLPFMSNISRRELTESKVRLAVRLIKRGWPIRKAQHNAFRIKFYIPA